MLRIENLQKNYGQFHLYCTMQVEAGRVTGLIGQNGAGKSTAFKAALGLVRPDGGSVELFGKKVEEITAGDRQKLGVVLADSGFSGYLTVKDMAAVMQGLYTHFDREKLIEGCRQSNLPLDKKIKEFSTGMQVKLKVLAAVSHGAEFLILDEPTAGLDVVARDEIHTMLREFMEEDERRSILISSHISSDLESLCDDIYMIHNGEMLLHEETDVLLGQYGILKVDEQQYRQLDGRYILRQKKESFGWQCLTDQRQYYLENYPGMVVEKGSIDELIFMMVKGETV